MLYSYRGQQPAPLPFRITLPNGFTRTDPSTFTEEELWAAGFTGPYSEPSYNPATERLTWTGEAYVVTQLPPPDPEPDWQRFKTAILQDLDINEILAQALFKVPAAVTALAPTLLAVEQGSLDDFLTAWRSVSSAVPIPLNTIRSLVNLATDCNLPLKFISAIEEKSEAIVDPYIE